MHDADRETQEIVSAWRSGNSAKLAALMSEDFKNFPSLYHRFVNTPRAIIAGCQSRASS